MPKKSACADRGAGCVYTGPFMSKRLLLLSFDAAVTGVGPCPSRRLPPLLMLGATDVGGGFDPTLVGDGPFPKDAEPEPPPKISSDGDSCV